MKFIYNPLIKLSALFLILLNICCLSAENDNSKYKNTALLLETRNDLEYIIITDQKAIQGTLIKEVKHYDISPQSKKIIFQKNGSNELFSAQIIDRGNDELRLNESSSLGQFNNNDVFFTISNKGDKIFWAKYENGRSSLWVMTLPDGNFVTCGEVNGYPYRPSWSYQDEFIAFYLKEESPSLQYDDYGMACINLKTGKILLFSKSKPIRPTPLRTWGPSWNNNDSFVAYEGTYDNFAKRRVLLLDIAKEKLIPFIRGYWVGNDRICYVKDVSTSNSMEFLTNNITKVIENDYSRASKIGEIDLDAFSCVYYDDYNKRLYFQTLHGVLGYYDFNLQKKIEIKKINQLVKKLISIYF